MDDKGNFDLATYLYNKRKQLNLTQTQVAKEAGLSVPYISMLEKGKKTRPTTGVIKKLAKALSIPNQDVMMLLQYIAASSNEDDPKTESTEEPIKLHLFDITGLNEKDIKYIEEIIQLLKIRAEYEKIKNG
ncbi:helix-turn-helix domain-containing protein [Bacillus haynesii]|jgi:transcriptional regulator with XRE-family HTH domain|uniref:helix-turn-helix domain-containing protein n=1 Tax=Bacillus TaxID=1386 RepID=UPI0007794F7C|nr:MULTISPECIES: helix-turn-helix domain-containing protein [Bacillus]MBW7636385.1 helix-turn-helix domain-containing protein [Bacillus licheniformis]MCY7967800.1 helix-turn-helix domain-containing protein [Bacillus haynesii]MCY8102372.1 helix-turn-helix domain-containing protein [Bacillus haynesii]MCY8151338.1 helix-turn-helix domain-containing protein [Bacillus paralicheniformis]MCY8665007.1 helix-turn-helix domain-containing protein [Bacillus haynesii]